MAFGMRIIPVLFCILLTLEGSVAAQDDLISAARGRIGTTLLYDPAYKALDYPGGDVPDDRGVCTDVIIRSLRQAYGFDLQRSVHEDMVAAFASYPAIWGLSKPDKNIDHRRVPNLETYFKRIGAAVPLGEKATDYKPGDIVTWRIGGRLPHIGVISDATSPAGTPLVIHNMGWGTREDDILFAFPRVAQVRFHPRAQE